MIISADAEKAFDKNIQLTQNRRNLPLLRDI